jgi:hypothetical protein
MFNESSIYIYWYVLSMLTLAYTFNVVHRTATLDNPKFLPQRNKPWFNRLLHCIQGWIFGRLYYLILLVIPLCSPCIRYNILYSVATGSPLSSESFPSRSIKTSSTSSLSICSTNAGILSPLSALTSPTHSGSSTSSIK